MRFLAGPRCCGSRSLPVASAPASIINTLYAEPRNHSEGARLNRHRLKGSERRRVMTSESSSTQPTGPRQFGALYDRHFQQNLPIRVFRVREQTAQRPHFGSLYEALKACPDNQDTGRPFCCLALPDCSQRHRGPIPDSPTIANRLRISMTVRRRPALETWRFNPMRSAGSGRWSKASDQQRTALVLKFQET